MSRKSELSAPEWRCAGPLNGRGMVMAQDLAVYAIFNSETEVEAALGALRQRGYRNEDISVFVSGNAFPRNAPGERPGMSDRVAKAIGLGAMIGGPLVWAIDFGARAAPQLGVNIASDPFAAVLIGACIGGAAGGFFAAFASGREPWSKLWSSGKATTAHPEELLPTRAGMLISVHCENFDAIRAVSQLLRSLGARDTTVAREMPSETYSDRRS